MKNIKPKQCITTSSDFTIYCGHSLFATVKALSKCLVASFEVIFFNGTRKIFKNYLSNGRNRWMESGTLTQLAAEVGKAIEYHQEHGNEVQCGEFRINNKPYISNPCVYFVSKNTVFKVYPDESTYIYPQHPVTIC